MSTADARPNASVRRALPSDLEHILEVERRAFGGDVEAELVRSLVNDPDAFVPDLSLVAEADGVIVGHVLFTRAWSGSGEEPTPGFVLLAPLAVVPELQRHGAGTALVQAGLARARELGFVTALVLGDPGYYSRFGFVPAQPQGLDPPYPVDPPEAWMAVGLVPGASDALTGTGAPSAPARTVVVPAEAFRDPALWRE